MGGSPGKTGQLGTCNQAGAVKVEGPPWGTASVPHPTPPPALSHYKGAQRNKRFVRRERGGGPRVLGWAHGKLPGLPPPRSAPARQKEHIRPGRLAYWENAGEGSPGNMAACSESRCDWRGGGGGAHPPPPKKKKTPGALPKFRDFASRSRQEKPPMPRLGEPR